MRRISSEKPTAPHTLIGALAVGTVIGAATAASEVVEVWGATDIRVCAKVTAASTLKLYRMRPDGETASEIGNPADVALAANTENKIDLTLVGDGFIKIEILAGAGAATVTFVDVFTA